MITNDNDFTPELPQKFSCEKCLFASSNKKDYRRHLMTAKHKMITNDNDFTPKNPLPYFVCECGKQFKYRPNLCRHKRTCKTYAVAVLDNERDEEMNYKELVMTLVNENKELRKTITDLIPKVGTTNNTIITNNNQKFNINIFLNETCKDAISIDQFVQSLDISIKDLFYTKTKGIADGVSNIFIENINKLPIHERPMHCTDIKRETLYIKEDNSNWTKDDNKETIKKAIKRVSSLQVKNINKFTELNPDFMENDKKKDDYIDIVRATTMDIDTKTDKIVRELCKNVYISRT
jgi:hypothetical protein